MVSFLLCPHVEEGVKEFSGIAFIRVLIPTTSQRPQWEGASHWGLGSNMWIWGERKLKVYSVYTYIHIHIHIHIEKAHTMSIQLGKFSQTECSLKPTSKSRNRTSPGIACFQDDGHQFLPSMHKKEWRREVGCRDKLGIWDIRIHTYYTQNR